MSLDLPEIKDIQTAVSQERTKHIETIDYSQIFEFFWKLIMQTD